MIDKNVIALGWVSFFTDMASSMVTTLLPIFVVYVLHDGADKLGIVIAIATFVSYFFRILFGYLSDKYQIVKPFVIAGYAISAVTKPLLAISHSYISVSILRTLERMGKAIRSASKDSLISAYVKEKADGKTFGFHKMMDIAGEMSGALIIFFIFLFYHESEMAIRWIFASTLIPGILATFIVIIFVKDVPKKISKRNIVINKEDYKLLPLLFIYFLFLFFLVSDQFLILLAKEDGYSFSTIPLFIVVFTFTQTISSYYSGILSDKIGSKKVLLISFIFGIFSVFFIKVNLWLSFIFLALFTILSLNAIRSYISKHAISKGFVFGIFYGGVAIFSALGALIIGYILEYHGIDSVMRFSEIGMSLDIVVLIFSYNNHFY